MTKVRSVLLVALLVTVSGCWGNEATEFPPGLEPLEENLVPPPTGTLEEPYPEGWTLEGVDGGRYDTVFARGYIHAPVAAVWDAFRDADVGADRRGADEWTTEPLDDPAYDESFIVHSVAHRIVTVEWSTTWRMGLVEGTAEAPEVVAIVWQKTDGATILRVIEGSLILRATPDPSATEIDLVYHVNATASGLPEYRQYVEDILGDALAVIAGDSLPVYD